ncbi:acetylcholine receptor subunit alpha-like [Mercenaria mercenaria]|uniref:acetylcholine receptor subunit alpha-like n=1 Tax=Mercenaria mercenaria TaxID=6596 RepID=UPI001E1E16EB|nr:acetylcholine receptor subunit alpha-like [Mercenaria mercenaria]XP_045176448.1 acetylcholine receptor subunit alpha-like [Mercenaria mercenaria]XP_053384431.1 acetylcholine receptor subunit alpha-like [Mercenaria mercenaria]XP_053384433.1 acetylcholine receptor subunit alpha-like [Mercenaria mercenaria]
MTIIKMLLFVTCIIMLNAPLFHCHTINDTNRLLKDKLTDYNKSTRPTYNQSTPTAVTFGFEMVYIQEFDEVQQKLSIMALPGLNWTDESMMWNPADYGGLFSLVTESGPFWTPNLVLSNSIGEWKRIGADWQTIRFFLNGAAYYNPGEIYSSACTVDVTYYPWDIHNCLLIFSPQGFSPSEVYLTLSGNKVSTTYYIENGGWAFVDSRIQPNYSTYYTDIYIELIFERKPRYVIVNVIMPIIFMAFLSNVVFLIPADCGERISYSITVLLAIAVYLTLVGDNLPKTSNPMSYFSYYLLALLVTSICIAMATVVNLRIYHCDETDPVTDCWVKIATCFKCLKRKRKAKYKKSYQNGYVTQRIRENVQKPVSYLHVPKVRVPLQIGQHSDMSDVQEMATFDDSSNSDKNISWKDVSVALDKIFFGIFFIILTVATVVYAVIISTCERAKLSE